MLIMATCLNHPLDYVPLVKTIDELGISLALVY